jgi:hypothetical protein
MDNPAAESSKVAKSSLIKEVRDWVDILFKITVAIAGVVVGYYFSFQKQQNEDVRVVVDMVTSDQLTRRMMGASLALEYVQQKRIPDTLYASMVRYANVSGDVTLQTFVNTGAAAAAQNDSTLKSALVNATKGLPIRVYFHISRGEDRLSAQAIKDKVEAAPPTDGMQVIVPGIQLIQGATKESVLKCFKKAECASIGPSLQNLFAVNGVPIKLVDLSQTYEGSTAIRPNHFEAWFGPLGTP